MTGARIARVVLAMSRQTHRALSRRVQAALLSAVLATSAGVPAGIAGATDADRQGEGPPGQGASEPDPAGGTDFDPGGATTSLGQEAGAHDQTASSDDAGAPIESEPGHDTEAAPERITGVPIPTATTENEEAAAAPATGETATDSSPSASDASPGPVAGAVAPTLPASALAPAADPQATKLGAEPDAGAENIRKQHDRVRQEPDRRVRIPTAQLDLPARSAMSTPAGARTATSTPVAKQDDPRRARNARWHTVAQGECLWTIAAGLLGLPQDSSPENNARIQAEVDRLWKLNADRIGTGDPSQINVGTKIRLR